MSDHSKNLLYISKKPIIVFFILLSLAWIVPAINLMIHGQISSSIKLFLFGCAYLIALFIAQTFFKRMLILYQKNLDKSIKKSKGQKYLKSRRLSK